MKKNNVYTIIASDGIKLFVRDYVIPNSNTVILLIHGLGEHSGRYLKLIQDFNDKDISVFTIDLRGHGKSEGKRGHSPSYKQLMNDIQYFINYVTDKISNQKYFLYGHSFGGNLVINYSLHKNKKIHGVIATSPCIKPAVMPSRMKLFIGKVFQKFIPSFRLSNGIKISGISKNSQVVKDYINDPLTHNKISIQLSLDLISSGIFALENSKYITIPMLVFHGANDKLTSYRATKQLVENSGSNIKFIGFDDAYHEIHNELEKVEMLRNIFIWMNSI